jgi:hypothetical protein
MKYPEYKIGDEFYIVIQEEYDCSFYVVYKGKVCGYLCDDTNNGECFCEGSGFSISFYKTIILDCYPLKKVIEKGMLDIDEQDPYSRLEELGVIGEFNIENNSLELDILTGKEKEMHKNVYSAIESMSRLYDEQHNEEVEESSKDE